MIIMGFPGVGKSTLANLNPDVIDLESSDFKFGDPAKDTDWEKRYVREAEKLSQSGKVVFTSTHKVVRDLLWRSSERVVIVTPIFKLKEKWIKKLSDRWMDTHRAKDYRAYVACSEHYDDMVKELIFSGFAVILISDIDYNLNDLLKSYITAHPTGL